MTIIDFNNFKQKQIREEDGDNTRLTANKIFMVNVYINEPESQPKFANLFVRISSEINGLESLLCQMIDDTILIHQQIKKQVKEKFNTSKFTIVNMFNLGIESADAGYERLIEEFNDEGKE